MVVYVSNSPGIIAALRNEHEDNARYICTYGPLFDLPEIDKRVAVDIIEDFNLQLVHASAAAKKAHAELLKVGHMQVIVVTTPTIYGEVFASQVASVLGRYEAPLYCKLPAIMPRCMYNLEKLAVPVNMYAVEAFEVRKVIERITSLMVQEVLKKVNMVHDIEYFGAHLLAMMVEQSERVASRSGVYTARIVQKNGFSATLTVDKKGYAPRRLGKTELAAVSEMMLNTPISHTVTKVVPIERTPAKLCTVESILRAHPLSLCGPILDSLEGLYYSGCISHPFGVLPPAILNTMAGSLGGKGPEAVEGIVPLKLRVQKHAPMYQTVLSQWLDTIQPPITVRHEVIEFQLGPHVFVGFNCIDDDDWRDGKIPDVHVNKAPKFCVDEAFKLDYQMVCDTQIGMSIDQLPHVTAYKSKMLRALDKLLLSDLVYLERGTYRLAAEGHRVGALMRETLGLSRKSWNLNEEIVAQVEANASDKMFALRSWFHGIRSEYESSFPEKLHNDSID